MLRILLLLGLVAVLPACGDGQPFFEDPPGGDGGGDDGGGDDGGDDGGVGGDPDLPPGTERPTPQARIFRFEAEDGQGGGFVRSVRYDAATDRFTVDNLAFDGDRPYRRDRDVPTLSGGGRGEPVYAVYEARTFERDAQTGRPIRQLEYQAIYGVSARTVREGGQELPASRFAIVRTGSYAGYGFGGFVYERNGGVVLPASGQARYDGEYAGMRVFDGRPGLEYTRGDVDMAIDFRDFRQGRGVRGEITNRRAFDQQGRPVPLGTGEGELPLPDLLFTIGPGTMTPNGEMTNALGSRIVRDGRVADYETGRYYAILGGRNADEVVGVFVVESDDPRFDGVRAQETGGFILYR
ncbi:hypothetical protein [Rubellimicrobium sp. CFH 75288]|uniref:hypothetical protein n=1 Tax=Rubellimicrobium sp. CFH 75288 TaxID=2697034 RepID=UPI001412B033|nr:hypothetical protein [Rubellimicrobium sp. CFH 75288]NAZ36501.1 hypothetical protein [Rubellimicrobium sp. CFH 75288]